MMNPMIGPMNGIASINSMMAAMAERTTPKKPSTTVQIVLTTNTITSTRMQKAVVTHVHATQTRWLTQVQATQTTLLTQTHATQTMCAIHTKASHAHEHGHQSQQSLWPWSSLWLHAL